MKSFMFVAAGFFACLIIIVIIALVDFNLDINIGDSSSSNTKTRPQNQPTQILDSVYTEDDCFTCLVANRGAIKDTARLQRSAVDEALINILMKTDGKNLFVKNGRYVSKVQERTEYTNDDQAVCYAQVTLYKKEK